MSDTFELNRMEFNILKCLYDGGYTDKYHSVTITELLNDNEKLGARMTVYRKLNKLVKARYIKKGIIDNHADTFYLLDKAIRIIEGRENNISNQQISRNRISYDNESVRNKLIDIMGRGLLLKAIAVNAGISESDLSRFKGGMNCLKKSDIEKLSEYLNAVMIPQQILPNEKIKKSYRDMLF